MNEDTGIRGPGTSRAATRGARLHQPIVIALGANLPSRLGTPRRTLEKAVAALARAGVTVYRRSPWFRSAPVPPSAQGVFLNAVVLARSALGPRALLALLHGLERRFGRVRRVRNGPRPLDLDLIAYGALVSGAPGSGAGAGSGGGAGGPILPHPRAHARDFVLKPLGGIAPAWRHPVLGKTAQGLSRLLPAPRGTGGATILTRPLRVRTRRLTKRVRPEKRL